MRLLARSLCLVLVLAALPAAAFEFDTTDWYQGADGYARALEQSRQTGKPMMLYFRTDWCPYCKQFEKLLLSAPEVRQYCEAVLKVTINPEVGRDEYEIAAAYRVRGYPAIFMQPGDGPARQVRRTVMRNGRPDLQTPEQFVETLSRAID